MHGPMFLGEALAKRAAFQMIVRMAGAGVVGLRAALRTTVSSHKKVMCEELMRFNRLSEITLEIMEGVAPDELLDEAILIQRALQGTKAEDRQWLEALLRKARQQAEQALAGPLNQGIQDEIEATVQELHRLSRMFKVK